MENMTFRNLFNLKELEEERFHPLVAYPDDYTSQGEEPDLSQELKASLQSPT